MAVQHLPRRDIFTSRHKGELETEQKVRKAYYEKLSQWKDEALQLFKAHHINYLTRKLVNLPTSFENLDASQPWLAYWIVHSLRLLNFTISDETKEQLIRFLASTQHVDGGFGGGPYQFSHLAPTYGAVNCLVSLCRADALQVIDRDKLANWLRRLRRPDGSLIMHIGGESDVRGAYCAAAVAKLTGILDKHPDLFAGTAEWVARCQVCYFSLHPPFYATVTCVYGFLEKNPFVGVGCREVYHIPIWKTLFHICPLRLPTPWTESSVQGAQYTYMPN
ncbi:unnamed protein product [Echinostoma caproni]|uniref:Protein farnesyltransferase subunit beta n=1 Tax=Echinostoma caproni TaxID=27848 RepID=A0A183B7I0_9TREM|nr:unnamed protein product [Echinostoma caproni]